MHHHLQLGLFRALIALLLAASAASAEASQYCRHGLAQGQVDFCMAVSLYHNHSSAAHDLYLKLAVRRTDDAANVGWTAIGTGSHMQGSLMFIVYGDPARQPPTLSVRTTQELHNQPLRIESHAGLDARVLDAQWIPSAGGNKTWTAELSAVCYGCSNWSGEPIAVESVSQPWIWGWNKKQDMRPYDAGVRLRRHELENGGFGIFYVDMKAAATHHAEDAMPTIQAGAANIHTSETPMAEGQKPGFIGRLKERPLLHLHGFFMSVAFLALFPIGAASIRSKSTKAFKLHWTIQMSAFSCALAGAATAIYMTGGDLFGSPHQIAGILIASLLILQAVLGWRHHVNFVRIRRRTIISYCHMSLGFILLLGGWANIVSGAILAGVLGKTGLVLLGGLVVVEVVGVGGWAYLARRRQRATEAAAAKEPLDAAAAYFALDDIESDGDDNDDDDGVEEQRGLMKRE